MTLLTFIVFTGIGATSFTDVWALLRKQIWATPLPDWALVGRWLAHAARGKLRHVVIARATPVPGERILGWVFHYLVGIAFAAVLLLVWGEDWAAHPRLAPALIVGTISVAAPFLILQPGMGAGFAASRTPRPHITRLHSLATHTVFGIGLFVSGWIMA
jgi:hypothetical protein